MAYVGLVPQQSLLSTYSETFSGDGSTLQFTLARSVSKASDLEVFVGNTQQLPAVAYTAANNQLLFASAPTAGTNNITVIFRAGALQTINVVNQSFNQGTTVAPSVNATVAPTTGIYWPSTTDMALAANGALRVSINSAADSTSTSTGAVVVQGGIGITGNVYTGGDTRITSSTAALSASTGALVVTGGVGIGGALFVSDDLQVAGDFTVNGTFTTTASDSLAITDPFVFLAADNTGDALDQGFVGKYVDGGSVIRYTGFFRDVTDGRYKLFDNLTNQPTTVVDTGNASYALGNLDLGSISSGNIQISGNNIISTNSNGNINISPDGTGKVVVTGLADSDLISTRLVYVGADGLLVDNENLTFTGTTLTLTGTSNVAGVLNVDNIQIDGNTIASTDTNGNIDISPNGTGNINLNDPVQATSTIQATRFISNIATGTAPFTVTSTTQVANLNAATAGSATTAGTVTTAAQPNITSTGTLTSLTVSGTSNFGNITLTTNTTSYRQNSTANWSGDAGAGVGKLEYHSNRWYVNAGSDSTLVCQFRRGASDVAYVDNSGIYNGRATSANYADLAENYQADAAYEPGTVVSFGGDAEITLSSVDHDARVAGVISTNPAHLMNNQLQGPNVVALGLTGRVPCKVRGIVRKGDLIVSAGDGRARAESNPKMGAVIGKALQDHLVDADGVIEVVVGRV